MLHKMFTKLMAAALVAVVSPGLSGRAAATVDTVDSRIAAATVYPDRARVARSAEVTLTSGTHTLVFEGIPTAAEAGSFRVAAEGLAGITILGFNHTTREHFHTPREKAAELERKIRKLTRDSLTILQDRLEVLEAQKELLRAMTSEKGTDAAHAAGVGEIDVTRWAEAYEFLGRRLAAVTDSIRQTKYKVEDATARIGLMERQLSSIQSQRGTVTRVVAVDVRLEEPGAATYSLDYLIPGASWQPIYDARLIGNGPDVELGMFAEVRQNTGESWEDIDLTLSTVQPSFGTGPGEMVPWYLASSWARTQPIARGYGRICGTLTDGRSGEPIVGASVLVVGTQQGAQTDFDGKYVIPQVAPGNYTLRVTAVGYAPAEISNVDVAEHFATDQRVALQRSEMDLNKTIAVVGKQDKLKIREVSNEVTISKEEIATRPVTTVDELLNQVAGVQMNARGEVFLRGGKAGEVAYIVDEPSAAYAFSQVSEGVIAKSYEVPGKQTVSSDQKAVRCPIGSWTLHGQTMHLCRSRLQEGVFRQIRLTNTTGTPLLAGQINIYAEGAYLGRGLLQQAVDGEEFALPFGMEPEVTVTRGVLNPKSEVEGERAVNRETVRVTLRNHGSEAIMVTVEEALPVSRDAAVEVKVKEVVPEATSVDEFGLAMWAVEVPAGKSRTVEYTFQIKYPVGMRIQGL